MRAAVRQNQPLEMESPLQNPPHVAEHPQSVLAVAWRLVDEVSLIRLNPPIGVFRREMPVPGAQFTDGIVRVKALITLWVLL